MIFPVAAAEGAAEILTALFVVLLAAKIGEELARRLNQPGVVGMIVAGIIIGPSGLGLIETGDVLEAFAELGVVLLLFWVGLETRVSELRAVGRSAALIGTVGFLVPLVAGVAMGLALGEDGATAIFLGAALVATSVGITSAVLIDLGIVDTPASRAILGAAIIDDILALLMLSVAEGAAGPGGVDLLEIGVVGGMTVAFLGFFAFFGTRLARQRPQLLSVPSFPSAPLVVSVLICLGMAALAAQIGLAAIIGGFLAGMILAETRDQHPIEEQIEPLYQFFPPFFFVFVGLQVDLSALGELDALLLLGVVTVIAVISKFAGAYLGARGLGRDGARLAAIGMVPRGEVGIIVAEIGLVAGAFDAELFAVVVMMSILTTLIAPPLLRRAAAELRPAAAPARVVAPNG